MGGPVGPAGKLGLSEVQRHGVSALQIDGGEAAAVVRLLALAGAAVAEEALVLGAGVAGQRLDGGQAGGHEAPGDVALEVEEEMARPLGGTEEVGVARVLLQEGDRKSTRLNSSH